MALRNIILHAANNFGTQSRISISVLASAIQAVVVSAGLISAHFHPVHVILDGEYVWNIAFNRDDIAARGFANPIPAGPTSGLTATDAVLPNVYTGGNKGWLARMTVGHTSSSSSGTGTPSSATSISNPTR